MKTNKSVRFFIFFLGWAVSNSILLDAKREILAQLENQSRLKPLPDEFRRFEKKLKKNQLPPIGSPLSSYDHGKENEVSPESYPSGRDDTALYTGQPHPPAEELREQAIRPRVREARMRHELKETREALEVARAEIDTLQRQLLEMEAKQQSQRAHHKVLVRDQEMQTERDVTSGESRAVAQQQETQTDVAATPAAGAQLRPDWFARRRKMMRSRIELRSRFEYYQRMEKILNMFLNELQKILQNITIFTFEKQLERAERIKSLPIEKLVGIDKNRGLVRELFEDCVEVEKELTRLMGVYFLIKQSFSTAMVIVKVHPLAPLAVNEGDDSGEKESGYFGKREINLLNKEVTLVEKRVIAQWRKLLKEVPERVIDTLKMAGDLYAYGTLNYIGRLMEFKKKVLGRLPRSGRGITMERLRLFIGMADLPFDAARVTEAILKYYGTNLIRVVQEIGGTVGASLGLDEERLENSLGKTVHRILQIANCDDLHRRRGKVLSLPSGSLKKNEGNIISEISATLDQFIVAFKDELAQKKAWVNQIKMIRKTKETAEKRESEVDATTLSEKTTVPENKDNVEVRRIRDERMQAQIRSIEDAIVKFESKRRSLQQDE